MKPDKHIKETLRYDFTDAEITQIARDQGQKLKDRSVMEEEKKRVANQYKTRIETLDGEIEADTDKINTGYEMRMIECEVYYNQPEAGHKSIVRTDTSKLVRTERMTQMECQAVMDFEAEQEEAPEKPEPLAIEGEVVDLELEGMIKSAFELLGEKGALTFFDLDMKLKMGKEIAQNVWEELIKRGLMDSAGTAVQLINWISAAERLPDAETAVVVCTEKEEEFTGSLQHDEDYDMEVFEADCGTILFIEHIAKWRDLTDEETEARENGGAGSDADTISPTGLKGEVFTRRASDNKGRDESGKVTASATESEEAAACAVIRKLHPDIGDGFDLEKADEQREFRKGTLWNVWSYDILQAVTAE